MNSIDALDGLTSYEFNRLFTHKNLLSTNNLKLVKGEKFNWKSFILNLKSGDVYFKNKLRKTCTDTSEACLLYCLDHQKRGKFTNVKWARMIKTKRYFFDPKKFKIDIYNEIKRKGQWWAKNRPSWRTCYRLDGTSDLGIGRAIAGWPTMQNYQFYDYSKNPNVLKKYIKGHYTSNYHLTFSWSGENKQSCLYALENGVNVAVPILNEIKAMQDLPSLWHPNKLWGYPVINGENSDLRFLDSKQGAIVALKPKGSLIHDTSGFLIRGSWA